ncbi:hypothetical protein H0H93_014547, partial [Arthromyces matolae]
MLGDNPMQSEFACHIGLRGRKFCRVCNVEGDVEGAEETEGPATAPIPSTTTREGNESDTSVVSDSSNPASTNKSTGKRPKRTTKKTESMEEMTQRVENFMRIGSPRTKLETMSILQELIQAACRVHGAAEYKRIKTRTGIKDTYLDEFANKLFEISTQRGKSRPQKEGEMQELRRTFPKRIISPVWCIPDFDPHADTPVEILHVILLGFVKYFWRDAVNRLKVPQKQTLIARLSSLKTSGLATGYLSGTTLVTYAGSLTG